MTDKLRELLSVKEALDVTLIYSSGVDNDPLRERDIALLNAQVAKLKAMGWKSPEEIKSQVEGLTVIGDEEIEVAYADGLEHGAPFTKIAKAQLLDCQRRLGGME